MKEAEFDLSPTLSAPARTDALITVADISR